MYRIEHIENLIGLAALPLLIAALWFLLSWKKRTMARIGDPSLVRQLVSNFSSARFLIKAGILLLAFLIIVIGAGNPQKPGKMENVKRKGVDVMVVLDVSKSMLATDIKPSRLDKAKQLLLLMLDKLENDRIGLVLFAGRAYLQMPLTSDHGAARMYIQEASPDAVPTQGTVIAEALRMANSAFNSKERKYKSILLISDGEDHDPDALKVAKDLAKDGVMINTVGIGSPDGSPIVDPATGELKKDAEGNTVISKLNEAELQQLSNATNGQYIRLDNVDDALITMTQQIDSVDKKSMSDAEFVDYISYFQWFLGIALLFLAFDYFFPERRSAAGEKRERAASGAGLGLRASAGGSASNGASGAGPKGASGSSSKGASATRPGVAGAATLLALAVLVSALPASAQSTNGQIRSGNRAYKKGDFEKSVQQYQRAVQQTPNSPTANYNLGNAQFKNNKFDEAAHAYDATVQNSTDKGMKEKGYYNKGVAMIRQKKLQESIDAWKNALRLDAGDTEARDNLEKALKEQKKQQQQQQQQQNQKKDQKNQDKQDQKKEQQQQQQQQQEPKPQPSKLNKQQVEQLLKALEQKEKDLHDKMQQNKQHVPNQPEKDW